MSASAVTDRRASAQGTLPRLLAAGQAGPAARSGLDAHLELWGPPSYPASRARARMVEVIEASGLRGRGGAWFPTGRKWRTVGGAPSRRRPIVVANGSESEPASGKDRILLDTAPHLVIDGLLLAAATVGARRAVVSTHEDGADAIVAALADRDRRLADPLPVEVVLAPHGYLSGEQSSVVNFLDAGVPLRPRFERLRPTYLTGVSAAPTLVQNVETLAHAALIGRFGAGWFRELGTRDTPGSTLVTVRGAIGRPGVYEIGIGMRLGDLLGEAGGPARPLQAVLLGGYGGSWLPMPLANDLTLDPDAMGQAGASLGAGVVVAMADRECPVAHIARVVRYMQRQSAGQCGPCVYGLAALADTWEALASARRTRSSARRASRVEELCGQIDGRGACRHPDGVVRFVRSALSVFREDVQHHVRQGPCGRSADRTLLPGLAGEPHRAREGRFGAP